MTTEMSYEALLRESVTQIGRLRGERDAAVARADSLQRALEATERDHATVVARVAALEQHHGRESPASLHLLAAVVTKVGVTVLREPEETSGWTESLGAFVRASGSRSAAEGAVREIEEAVSVLPGAAQVGGAPQLACRACGRETAQRVRDRRKLVQP